MIELRLAHFQLWITILVGVLGVAGAIWTELPPHFALPTGVAWVLLLLYLSIRWRWSEWEPAAGSEDASTFTAILKQAHWGVRLGLVAIMILCGGFGLAAQHGPSWLGSEVTRMLLREHPETHPDVMLRSLPEDWLRDSGAEEATTEVFFLVPTGDEARLECAITALSELVAEFSSPVTWGSVAALLFLILLLLSLKFFEIMGETTYRLVPKELPDEHGSPQ